MLGQPAGALSRLTPESPARIGRAISVRQSFIELALSAKCSRPHPVPQDVGTLSRVISNRFVLHFWSFLLGQGAFYHGHVAGCALFHATEKLGEWPVSSR